MEYLIEPLEVGAEMDALNDMTLAETKVLLCDCVVNIWC